MAKATIKKFKASALHGKLKAAAAAAGAAPHTDAFGLLDNENDTCTVTAVDAAGNPVALDPAVVTITAVSDNTAILTVDPPTGLTFKMTAVGPLGTANVTATAMWSDGSRGPFSFTLPVEVKAGPATGVVIVPGTPVPNP